MSSHALDPRKALVSFVIGFEEDFLREDANDPESAYHKKAKRVLASSRPEMIVMKWEDEALEEVSKLFGRRVNAYGYDSSGALGCTMGVDSYADVKDIENVIARNFQGGADNIYLNAPYMFAGDFILHPQGVGGPQYGPNCKEGSIAEWLEE